VFRLLGRLESSELSELYRGARTDGDSVVIKLFHAQTTDLSYAKVIADSAQRLSERRSPGIARVLRVGLFQRRLAIVREDPGKYTLGQALTRLNTREAVLAPAVAIAIIIEVADVLNAAHQASVVHGALTPGNVLLGSDGSAAVADFGALDALMASPSLKKRFIDRGRSSYRAPEVRGADRGTAASDIYALGALAYELLTLKEAFVGSEPLPTRRGEKLPPPSRLVRRLHSRIDPIIMRALKQVPDLRYRSMAEFSTDLREFLAAHGGIPGLDDRRKFVDELFTKDVVVNDLGPVPFLDPFELDDIAGVSDLVAETVLPATPDLRESFSGGAVDHHTSTFDGLPVFPDDEVTTHPGTPPEELPEAEVDPSLFDTAPLSRMNWDKPDSAVLEVAQTENADVERSGRMKAIDDIAPHDSLLTPSAPKASAPARKMAPVGPKPRVNSKRQKLKTLLTFAVPFTRVGDYQPPDWRKEREDRRRAGITAVRLGAAILTVFTMGAVGLWFFRTDDAVGDLITWMPTPIEVELIKLRKPKAVGYPGASRVRPSKPKPPDSDQLEAVQSSKLSTTTPVPALEVDCYEPSREGPQALLTVALARAGRVELDGFPVCGVATQLKVTPGKHALRVIDGKTNQEWKSTLRLEAGKPTTVVPTFP
jgi:eukaryotic-like serine/threonine-protein kinase